MRRWCAGFGTLAASPAEKPAASVHGLRADPGRGGEGLAPRPVNPGFQSGVCVPVDPGGIEKRQSAYTVKALG
jgi:hypothetical protein